MVNKFENKMTIKDCKLVTMYMVLCIAQSQQQLNSVAYLLKTY